jgi:hypothetical protein
MPVAALASIRTSARALRNFNAAWLQGPMIDRSHDLRSILRLAAAMPRLVLGVGLGAGLCMSLGGCADVGDSFASSAFVDPAKYEQYDCKQLENERKALATRTAELQGLIAKADTGVGGSVVGELAYRNDYISARASAKLVEQMWQRDKCVATSPAVNAPAAPPAAVAPAHGHGHGSARSGSAVY